MATISGTAYGMPVHQNPTRAAPSTVRWSPYGEFWQDNLKFLCAYLMGKGFSKRAACAVAGNVAYESYSNPAQGETDPTGSGWGFIQWTPGSVIFNYLSSIGVTAPDTDLVGNIVGQAQAIDVECSTEYLPTYGKVWSYSGEYQLSGPEFKSNTQMGVNWLTHAYFYERERGTWNNRRVTYALYMYNLEDFPDPIVFSKPLPFWMMAACNRRRLYGRKLLRT